MTALLQQRLPFFAVQNSERAQDQPSAAHLDDLLLLGCSSLKRLHHQPGAFVVLDVGANLADHLRITIAVQVVVLYLQARRGHNAGLWLIQRVVPGIAVSSGARMHVAT